MLRIKEPWDWHPRLEQARTAFRIETAHGTFMLQQRRRQPWSSDASVTAYVDHGRWLSLCPHCGAGVALTPSIRDAGWCFGCGATFRSVAWPEALADIVAALEQRPSDVVQNWKPGETVEVLLAENLAHGVL